MWRVLLTGGLALLVTACQDAVSLGQRSPAAANVVQPWGKSEIQRSNDFVLPRDSRLTVAVIAEGHGPQETRVLGHLRTVLSQYFGPQDLAPEALLPDEATLRAQEQRADFVLTFRLIRWPGGFVDPAAYSCPKRRRDECDMTTIDPDMKMTLQVYDVVNGRVVDLLTANTSLGVQSWLVEDNSPLIDDTLSRMLDSLAP